MGGNGLREVSERAVLNANYVRHRLSGVLDVPFGGLRKHEFVASASKLAPKGVRTVDIAKRLMDFGYHPPTVYFRPLSRKPSLSSRRRRRRRRPSMPLATRSRKSWAGDRRSSAPPPTT